MTGTLEPDMYAAAPTHADLVMSLAQHVADSGHKAFRPVVIIERPVGSVWLERGVPIPDVLSIKPSYTRTVVTVYEVKASRADYMADVREDKWRRYLGMCDRFLFAAPAGLISKAELPESAGLITLSKNDNWSVAKAGKVHDGTLDEWQLLSLLFAGHEEARLVRDLQDVVAAQENWKLETSAVQLGKALSDQIAALAYREKRVKEREFEVDKYRAMIVSALKIDKDPDRVNSYDIERALEAVQNERVRRGLKLLQTVSADLIGEGYRHEMPREVRDWLEGGPDEWLFGE